MEHHQRGEIRRKEKYWEPKTKYKIKKKDIRTVIEELKQQLHAKTAKLKRYEERLNQYKINRIFVQTQKIVYQQMDGIRNTNNDMLALHYKVLVLLLLQLEDQKRMEWFVLHGIYIMLFSFAEIMSLD